MESLRHNGVSFENFVTYNFAVSFYLDILADLREGDKTLSELSAMLKPKYESSLMNPFWSAGFLRIGSCYGGSDSFARRVMFMLEEKSMVEGVAIGGEPGYRLSPVGESMFNGKKNGSAKNQPT